jgi:hypothetical protein
VLRGLVESKPGEPLSEAEGRRRSAAHLRDARLREHQLIASSEEIPARARW